MCIICLNLFLFIFSNFVRVYFCTTLCFNVVLCWTTRTTKMVIIYLFIFCFNGIISDVLPMNRLNEWMNQYLSTFIHKFISFIKKYYYFLQIIWMNKTILISWKKLSFMEIFLFLLFESAAHLSVILIW